MSDLTVIRIALDYIETHLNEDLSLDKLSKELNYSKFYLSRTFVKETGRTVYKYIQGRRLTIAAKKLAETQKPIVEIAYEAHYYSQQSFTVAFHRFYLSTPQAYRKIGVFYPKQTRIHMKRQFRCFSGKGYLWGGKAA